MAHSSRERYFEHLKEKLGDVPFFIDKAGEEIGVWENCKRAWLAYDPKADYHVVIQDDAIVCNNFKERAEAFIEKFHAERRSFNFFFAKNTGNVRNRVENTTADQGYIRRPRNAWGVAICIPTKNIPAMIEYCEKYVKIPQDDVRIGKYLFFARHDIIYPIPSIVDHRDEDTLVGALNRGRHAYKFIENEK